MIEIPEANVLAAQLNKAIAGKRVVSVIAAHSPHKFAWYHGDPQEYGSVLCDKTVDKATSVAGMVKISLQDAAIMLCDGARVRYHAPTDKRPAKHQLLLEFSDESAFSVSVQMYGGLWCFKEGDYNNPYYQGAKAKPSPLTSAFDEAYFAKLFSSAKPTLSAKAFLATEQRVPGLGNGVLQDILYSAGVHPKRRIATFADDDRRRLYNAIKDTLLEMIDFGGRDTECDLFGSPGGYKTILSSKTAKTPCPVCGDLIVKEAYLGGSVYYCPVCQPLS